MRSRHRGLDKKLPRVPTAQDWRGYELDLDASYAHKLLFGKNISEVQSCFGGGCSIERTSELLFMPRAAFQYYVIAFAEFIISEKAAGDSDSASSFMRLLVNREKRDPGSVSSIYPFLKKSVQFAAEGQRYFKAPVDIYGRFAELADELAGLIAR